jgi:hypothetical protein
MPSTTRYGCSSSIASFCGNSSVVRIDNRDRAITDQRGPRAISHFFLCSRQESILNAGKLGFDAMMCLRQFHFFIAETA